MLSPFTSKWGIKQTQWLSNFKVCRITFLISKSTVKTYKFQHITEHYGWLRADHINIAPFPVPNTEACYRIGLQRLAMMAKYYDGKIGKTIPVEHSCV